MASGDFAGLRRAIRLSYTMWGGRFNPIIIVDDQAMARRQVDLFRADALFDISRTKETTLFATSLKHLPWPLAYDEIFAGGGSEKPFSTIIDIKHPIARLHREHFKAGVSTELGLDIAEWDEDDPLSDALLCMFGGLPSSEETGFDYLNYARNLLGGRPQRIMKDGPIPPPNIGRMSLAALNRQYMKYHYSVQNFWGHPGFYIGRADDFEDLVNFWNVRATGTQLLFFDQQHASRLEPLRDFWANAIQQNETEDTTLRGAALWHCRSRPLKRSDDFGARTSDCNIDSEIWNGLNIKAPIAYFSETSVLASVDDKARKPEATFALIDQPFDKETEIFNQHFVLTVDPITSLFGNERVTMQAPFIPELNEFYGRNFHYSWNEARAEPEGLGIITDGIGDQASIRAVDVNALAEAIFDSVGIKATPSRAGLVATSLINQMGGLDGCRAFKIAGVRSLIENHRPDQSFSRATAMQTIQGADTASPLSKYQGLYIEARPAGSKLKNSAVLSYLLNHGVFRAGLKFNCPSCQLDFWSSLDDSKSVLQCEYCGTSFNVASQLKDKDWAFRRSGLFGRSDHQEGALPVTLALQQLMRGGAMMGAIYTTGMNLGGKGIRACETDFAVFSQRGRDHKIQIAIGECKTRQPITADDVSNLQAVGSVFPRDRYEVYFVFAKLAPFSPEEIELFKPLNTHGQYRVILLTDRELEPYFVYERTKEEFDVKSSAVTFGDLAAATDVIFFKRRKAVKT